MIAHSLVEFTLKLNPRKENIKCYTFIIVKCEVLMTMVMKIFCDVTLCSLTYCYNNFGGTWYLYILGKTASQTEKIMAHIQRKGRILGLWGNQ